MKKLRGSIKAKATAIVLLCIFALTALGSLIGVLALNDRGVYSYGVDYARSDLIASRTYMASVDALGAYMSDRMPFITNGNNFRYVITDEDGRELFSSYNDEPAYNGEQCSMYSLWGADGENVVSTAYLLKDMKYKDSAYAALKLFDFAASLRYGLIVIAAVCTLLGIALFVFLLSSAGHRDETDAITLGVAGKIPFDMLCILAVVIGLIIVNALDYGFNESIVGYALLGVAVLVCGLMLLFLCMTFAAWLKHGGLMKSLLSYKILPWCFGIVRRFFAFLVRALKAIPLIGRWIFAVAGVLFVEFIYMVAFMGDGDMTVFGWFVERAALVLGLLYAISCLNRLYKGGKAISSGDTAYKVDANHMKGAFLEHAENLNSINSAVQSAVNEQLRSERMRTELITNVSHDIKTPLTSIVSYVDLLEKENIANENAKEYLEVLSRQSAKLKKLIEDLIEASKASTGAIGVELTRCDAGVLLEQLQGEYSDRLEKAGLELVVSGPEESVLVMADRRHIWRVLDNLMNNICKYSMRGTRVYAEVHPCGETAEISFKNISAARLNITGEELKARFVRGDASRTTEGSGLGLSIAESLTKLQNGTLAIDVDGDLFKVTVTLKKA